MGDSTRLAFALAHLDPTDWQRFERFAGVFLADEYPDLRVVAGTGDRGRDAVLWASGDGVVVQYSVEANWRQKIRATIATLDEEHVAVHVFIYATNRNVGPRADLLKAELRTRGIELDIRDDTYFTLRIEKSAATRGAARDLSAHVVDPLVPAGDSVSKSALADDQLRAGLLYLELNLEDAVGERNLTKLSYESVVLSCLAATGPDDRFTRRQIQEEVQKRFPGHQVTRIGELVNGALLRLRNKGRITYQQATDSYALHYSERRSLVERAAQLADERLLVRSETALIVADRAVGMELDPRLGDSDDFLDAVEETVEKLLERQGNEFVAALEAGEASGSQLDLWDVAQGVILPRAGRLLAALAMDDLQVQDLVEMATDVVSRILVHPGESMQSRLRRLADSYTLLAFLQQTPDVQKAVSKLFSRGRLVLDTNVVLPVFVETGLAVEEQQYVNLLRAAKSAGLALQVTKGVLNEIASHLNRSTTCARQPDRWHGDFPFVYQHWLSDWPGTESFGAFVDRFMGRAAPEDDLRDFLSTHLGIETIDLSDSSRKSGLSVVGIVSEIWRQRKHRRGAAVADEMSVDIRVNHDVEMYLGVLGLRQAETPDIYGHEAWLVTVDGAAFQMRHLAADQGVYLDSDPVMHPHFLTTLLRVGPSRATIEPSLKRLLPVALEIHERGWGVPGLAETAARIRARYQGQPEYFIRRKLREAMNQVKQRLEAGDDGAVDGPPAEGAVGSGERP